MSPVAMDTISFPHGPSQGCIPALAGFCWLLQPVVGKGMGLGMLRTGGPQDSKDARLLISFDCSEEEGEEGNGLATQ